MVLLQPQPVDDAEANIQNTNLQEDQQPLLYCKLPDDVANRHCLLMDSILSSGYTVVRAIEVLLVSLQRSCCLRICHHAAAVISPRSVRCIHQVRCSSVRSACMPDMHDGSPVDR